MMPPIAMAEQITPRISPISLLLRRCTHKKTRFEVLGNIPGNGDHDTDDAADGNGRDHSHGTVIARILEQ